MRETKFTTSRIFLGNGRLRRLGISVSIRNRSILVGFAIILTLFILPIAFFEMQFNWTAYATVGVTSALVLTVAILRQKRAVQDGRSEDAMCSDRIEADIFARLGVSSVFLDTSKGVVILHGTVPYPKFLVAAEQIALRAGARRVVNRLMIEQPAHTLAVPVSTNLTIVTTTEGASGNYGVSPEHAVQDALIERVKVDHSL